MFFSHMDVSLPLFLLPFPLSKKRLINFLKVAKGVDLKCSQHTHTKVIMEGDGSASWLFHILFECIKSIDCTTSTYTILYVKSISTGLGK